MRPLEHRLCLVYGAGRRTVLPTGEGLFVFNTMDEIVAAFESINSDYERQRQLAKSIFPPKRVLGKLITDLGFLEMHS